MDSASSFFGQIRDRSVPNWLARLTASLEEDSPSQCRSEASAFRRDNQRSLYAAQDQRLQSANGLIVRPHRTLQDTWRRLAGAEMQP